LEFNSNGKMFFGKYVYNETGERTASWVVL